MSRPRWWPMTITVSPSRRAQPPTIAASSRNARSPCSSMKSVKHEPEVVERERPLVAARHLHALQRREVRVDLVAQLGELPLERRDLLVDVELLLAGEPLQLVDLLLQLDDRLLELHGASKSPSVQLPRTRRTRSVPSSARKSVSAACVAASLSERDRSRARVPLPSFHRSSSGGAPGCASHAHRSPLARPASPPAQAARRAASSIAIDTCPFSRSSANGVTDSTMNVGLSASWSRLRVAALQQHRHVGPDPVGQQPPSSPGRPGPRKIPKNPRLSTARTRRPTAC